MPNKFNSVNNTQSKRKIAPPHHRGFRGWIAFLLACVVMLSITQTSAASEPFVGMWVWKERWLNTDAEQDRLIGFCREHGINRLLINIHFDDAGSDPTQPSIRYPKELQRLLGLARDAGIAAEALDSSRTISPEDQAKYLARLDTLIAFNAALPKDTRFVGIHYDIEPQVTPEFKESYATRVPVMLDMLNFFADARAKIKAQAPELTLACDTAMWFDGRTEGEKSCMVEYNGVTKNLHAHLQDLTDYIGVMSYRRFATGNNSVTHHIKAEIDYGNQAGRGVCAGVETGKKTAKASETSVISFYGLPSDFFWGEIDKIHETYRDAPAYRGVLIHCYGRFQEYLADNPPAGG